MGESGFWHSVSFSATDLCRSPFR